MTVADTGVIRVEQDHRWWSRIIQTVIVFVLVHYIAWIFVPLGILVVLYHYGFLLYGLLAVLLYLPTFFDGSHLRLGRVWYGFRDSSLWNWAHKHVGITLIRTHKLSPEKTYVFGMIPHSILILSRVLMYGGNWAKLFPGIDFRVLGATPMFWLPCCREMCLWMGGVDASKSTAERILDAGISLQVYPGGSKEIFETRPGSDETTIIIKERKGFVKLAMRHGADLVPTVVFGEKEAYHRMHINEGFRKWFLKTFRIPLIIFWGMWFTWTPLRKPIGIVFGAPISVTKNPNPTDEEVDALHQKFIEETQKLFDEYKVKFPEIPGADKQRLIIH